MASKRRLRRKSCEGKLRLTGEQAAAKASYLTRFGDGRGVITAYRCQFCGHHHVGRAPSHVLQAHPELRTRAPLA